MEYTPEELELMQTLANGQQQPMTPAPQPATPAPAPQLGFAKTMYVDVDKEKLRRLQALKVRRDQEANAPLAAVNQTAEPPVQQDQIIPFQAPPIRNTSYQAQGVEILPSYQQAQANLIQAQEQAAPIVSGIMAQKARRDAEILQASQRSQKLESDKWRSQRAEIDAKIAKNLAIDEETRSEVANMKIDPQAWWSNQSGWQKAMSAIGVALSAFGRGLQGKEGPNPVLMAIERQIAQDIEVQKWNIAKAERKGEQARGIVPLLFSATGNIDAASDHAQVMLKTDLADRLSGSDTLYKDDMQRAQGLWYAEQLRLSAEEKKQQMAKRFTIGSTTTEQPQQLIPKSQLLTGMTPKDQAEVAYKRQETKVKTQQELKESAETLNKMAGGDQPIARLVDINRAYKTLMNLQKKINTGSYGKLDWAKTKGALATELANAREAIGNALYGFRSTPGKNESFNLWNTFSGETERVIGTLYEQLKIAGDSVNEIYGGLPIMKKPINEYKFLRDKAEQITTESPK